VGEWGNDVGIYVVAKVWGIVNRRWAVNSLILAARGPMAAKTECRINEANLSGGHWWVIGWQCSFPDVVMGGRLLGGVVLLALASLLAPSSSSEGSGCHLAYDHGWMAC